MWGVEEILKRIESYRGERRKGVIGVDNKGVLEKLRKGRGMCGEREQNVRRIGEGLLKKGWELEFRWVPGHVDIEENEEADEKAKEGIWEEEDEEVGEVLCWGKWEQRRKEEERRGWKEFWRIERKGEEYFGVGGEGEGGHRGRRWESKFLIWMRTGHGAMRGARYIKERGDCECGGKETRDHILLYCSLWEKERKEVWEGWEGGVFAKEGWVEMDKLLFEEEGYKRVIEFGRKTGWMEKRRLKGVMGTEEKKGDKLLPWIENGGGWLRGCTEKRKQELLQAARERTRRWKAKKRGERKGLFLWDATHRKWHNRGEEKEE
ncbi:hypothetical protein L873DRAFT_1510206 [Choiromyces venosus 120613-1]|uniref:Uncharacterized protein n=1 Tax=Choiromyces venosus 120613-1 TaxID=1336337 RepID=A0A3N4J613_9PEZI|nr:hypothetical protein L873DRAFT_1510206 [Choiromyces venosus 120613-1]